MGLWRPSPCDEFCKKDIILSVFIQSLPLRSLLLFFCTVILGDASDRGVHVCYYVFLQEAFPDHHTTLSYLFFQEAFPDHHTTLSYTAKGTLLRTASLLTIRQHYLFILKKLGSFYTVEALTQFYLWYLVQSSGTQRSSSASSIPDTMSEASNQHAQERRCPCPYTPAILMSGK